MGRCQEFGLQIRDGCGHAMVAGKSACSCAECGVVCGGRFAGCPDVWERGPQPVTLMAAPVDESVPATRMAGNGSGPPPVARSPMRARAGAATAPAAASEAAPTSVGLEPKRAPEFALAPEAEAPPLQAHPPPPPSAPSTPPTPVAAPSTPVRTQSQPPASAAALRWLEGAFAGLRTELQSLRGHVDQQQAATAELINGITQQQLMLSELLDARDADFAVIELAEALPQLVSDAVAAQVRDDRRRTVSEIQSAVEEKLEKTSQEARAPEEKAAELRAFLQNDPSTRSIVAAVATQAATRAMRTEVTEQLEAIVAQSDARMIELSERMDAVVAERIDKLMTAVKRAMTPPAPKASGRVAKSRTPATKAKATAPSRAPRATKAVKTTRAAKATKATKATKAGKATKATTPTKAAKAAPAKATRGATARKSSPTRAGATKATAASTAAAATRRPTVRRTAAGSSGRSAGTRSRARAVPPLSQRDLEAEMALLQPS